jgi:acetyl esterase/lipase
MNLSIVQNEKIDESGNISGDYSPTLTMYLPDKKMATGAAVIICPGGGYSSLVIKTEGYPIAQYFVKKGIAAFILKYRLPKADIYDHPDPAPLEDAQEAMRKLRKHGKEWNIDTTQIGMMGFSGGGGHLVSTAGTHFDSLSSHVKETISVRPDFLILVYPVVSMTDSLGHIDSRKKFLGNKPTEEMIRLYSNELQVTERTSPALILHCSNDKVVNINNCLLFYKALLDKHVPAELHIYSHGGHGGFVLNFPTDQWMSLCVTWINYIVKKPDQ